MDKRKLFERMKQKYDQIVIGEAVDAYSYPMTPGRVLMHLEAIDETDNPFYATAGGNGTRHAPPTILDNDVLYSKEANALLKIMTPLRVLLTTQEYTFLNPVKTGGKIRVETEYVDKYIKRGKYYVSLKSISYDETDKPLLENVYTMCCLGADNENEAPSGRKGPFDRKVDAAEKSATTANGDNHAKADPEVSVEAEITSRTKTVLEEMNQLYWYYPAIRHFHNDRDEARKLGFPGPVTGGGQGNAIISEMCHAYFEDGWICGGQMAIKPLKSIHPPAKLTARGVVNKKEREGDQVRIHLDVWLENENKDVVQLGVASGLVPAV